MAANERPAHGAEPMLPPALVSDDQGDGPAPAPIPEPLSYDPPHDDPFGQRMAGGKIIGGRTSHRLLLFTFDDGPNRRTTPRLLDYLDAYGVKGVFFLTASRMKGETNRQRLQQQIAQDIVRRGHVVASHTLDHLQLPALDDVGVATQIDESERIFVDVLGQRPWLLRPPGGSRSVRVDNMIAARGYTSVLWNLGTGDFQVETPEDVFRVFMRVLEVRERDDGDRGGIVLLHDIHDHSVDAFPLIMDELRRRNCELLESGEELYDITDDPSLFFVDRGEASPSEVADPLILPRGVLEARQARLRVETAQRCAVDNAQDG
jgi:peptidoglycan/xylan/chitin deacetylase (PgdA/CDA1 family)